MQGSKTNPLKAVREKCLDCYCGSTRGVRFCPCDGIHSTRCPLWPFRFGKRVSTVMRGDDAPFLDPENIPDSLVELEKCDQNAILERGQVEGQSG